MTHCVNINHNSVKEFSEELNLPKAVIAAKIALWQESNTMDRFPSKEELLGNVNLEGNVEEELKKTGFFSKHNGLLFIKKHFYVDAIKAIAKFNKETPGLVKVNRANNFGKDGNDIFYVKINENLLTLKSPSQGSLFSSKIDYSLKSIEIINNNLQKIISWYKLLKNTDTFFSKLNKDLQIPKEQVELIKQELEKTNSIEKTLVNLQANYSYTVEINTTKGAAYRVENTLEGGYDDIEINSKEKFYNQVWEEGILEPHSKEFNDEVEKRYINANSKAPNSSYYSNLTVPGGTNYTENEIATPAITPSIKGHAQFSTDKGIGWFRSDDKAEGGNYDKPQSMPDYLDDTDFIVEGTPTRTRRILEVQSDLFQKGRDKEDLISRTLAEKIESLSKEEVTKKIKALEDVEPFGLIGNQEEELNLLKRKQSGEILVSISKTENQFLQLLNKDNNWVTFFVKSIIQDSAKKGYEKILFPLGETIAKIEQYGEAAKIYAKLLAKKQRGEKLTVQEENAAKEYEELNQKAVIDFYENTVANILKKQGYNPVEITDEYGNTWNEVSIDDKSLKKILFSTSQNTEKSVDKELNKILIDFLSQFGIKAEAVDNVMREGNYNVYAVADFVRKTISWAKGFESEIPEEAAHMIFEMIDTSIKDTIINLVMKTERFKEYRESHKELYATDREYAREVAGQMLAEEIKQQNSGLIREANTLTNWFTKLINYIKNLFKKGDVSSLDNIIKEKLGDVAKDVLEGNTKNLNIANLENETKLFSAETDLVDKQIKSLTQRKEMLNRTKNASNRRQNALQASRISESIKKLEAEKNYLTVFKVAYKDYKEAMLLIKKEDINAAQLMNIKRTIDRIINLDSYIEMDDVSDDLARNYKELRNRATELNKLWNKKQLEQIVSLSDEEGFDYTEKQIVAPIKDISAAKQEFISLDSSNIPLLNIAASIFESIKRDTRNKFIEYKKQSDEIRAKYTEEDFKQILDKEGRLIVQTKSEYFTLERKMLARFKALMSSATDDAQKAKLFSQRAKWYIDNNTYTLTEEGKELYEEHLQSITEDYTEEDGSISAESKKLIDAWVTQNSPYLGIKYANGGAYTRGNTGWFRYLSSTPADKWINPEYNTVKDKEVYKFVINTLYEGLKKLPHAMTVDVGNFDKAINEIIFDFNRSPIGFKSAYEGLGDFLSDTFQTVLTEDDIKGMEYGITDEEGNLKPIIKHKSVADIQKESKFKNPLDLLDKFYSLALAYEHKTQAEDKIWLIEDALKKQKAIRLTKANVETSNTIEGGLRRAQEQLLYNIQANLYNKVRIDEDNVTPTEKEKKEFEEELEKWREAVKEAVKNNQPIPEKPVLKKTTAVKSIDALVDFTRLNLLGLKPFSAITNLLVGLESNYLYAARNKDFSNADLNWAFRMLMGNVVKYMTWGKAEISPTVNKIANLAYKFGITSETLVEDADKYSGKFTAFLLGWQSGGEFIIANQILLAKMRRTKVKDLTGKERSLFDAYDENGDWNTKEFGEQNEWTNEKFIVDGKNTSKIKKFNDELKKARKRTQGDYIDAMKFKSKVYGRVLMVFRTWLPRAINERFGEQVGDDFKGRYRTYGTLINNNAEQMGYLKGTFSLLTKFLLVVTSQAANIPGLGHLGFKSLAELTSKKYEAHLKELGLSDLDIENMRVNVREVQFILYLFLLGLALKGLAGDDDDEQLTYSANIIQRLFQDTTFFYSFNSAFSIVKDPIPLYKTIQDSYDVLDRTKAILYNPTHIREVDTYQSGFRKGKSKLGKEVQDLIPIVSAFQSTLSTMEQVYGEQSYKYSK